MSMPDIRWRQRCQNYRQALSRLTEAVALSRQRPLSELEEQGMIQAFEFSHELAWNVLKDYLEAQGFVGIIGSRNATREAFKNGLAYEAKLGANPFKFGMIGSTDSHTSLATSDENNFFGKVSAVEPTAAEVEAIAVACRLDVVQIHLSSNDWKIDRPIFHGLEVWLAPRMGEDVNRNIMRAVDPQPSVLLADAFDPETIGGTGKISNWEQAMAMKTAVGKSLLLAGGLTPENVREAIASVKPWGVDVSSGVEKEPGVKDIRKVKQFIERARR
jgi:phosphoribosylanthranilate isomerase